MFYNKNTKKKSMISKEPMKATYMYIQMQEPTAKLSEYFNVNYVIN